MWFYINHIRAHALEATHTSHTDTNAFIASFSFGHCRRYTYYEFYSGVCECIIQASQKAPCISCNSTLFIRISSLVISQFFSERTDILTFRLHNLLALFSIWCVSFLSKNCKSQTNILDLKICTLVADKISE